MLKNCPLTDGESGFYRVDQVRTFVGQAFSVPDDAVAVLVLDSRYRLWHSTVSWRRRNPADADPAEGLAQLACKEFGQGRVVVAGEAAMFSAQLDGGKSWMPMGMNAVGAEQNWRLTLNIVRWLEHGAR